jgi:hypothetical protein
MSTDSQTTSFPPPNGKGTGEPAHHGHGVLSPEVRPPSQTRIVLKPFVLSPEMLTIFGVFYPTGYIVMMFPQAEKAEQAAHELLSGGYERDALTLLSPETILREIARVDGESDIALPSVGTEGATAQTFIKLAREGQFGLMVHAKSDEDTEAVMVVARPLQFSFAQKYHMLAMEDLK